jgi:hypothetical protein
MVPAIASDPYDAGWAPAGTSTVISNVAASAHTNRTFMFLPLVTLEACGDEPRASLVNR